MTQEKVVLEALLEENRKFSPSQEFKKNANIQDPKITEKAAEDPEKFWIEWARKLTWSKPFTKGLEWDPPDVKWFSDGEINASVNCIDRYVFEGQGFSAKRNKAALIWEGEPGDERVLTYGDLYREVCKCANAYKSLGVKKGDCVAIYMPLVPEIVIACLSAARIGAFHNVVFGGFSHHALAERIQDSKAKLLVTADYGYRRGKKILLKRAADEALATCSQIKHVIVWQREKEHCHLVEGRDHLWHTVVGEAKGECPAETCQAEDILFTLYTSGTTGKPKGIVHTTGGYLTGVFATTKWVFDLKDSDVFWCTADIGWVTGHSYVIYGPLSNGATVFLYEGAFDFPEKSRCWDLIEKYKVSILYTAPTAIRAFMKWGEEWLKNADLSSLRLLGSVGEPINPEAWMWYHLHIGKERCPIVDTWWQTETGAIMVTTLPGLSVTTPGYAGKPFPGIFGDVFDEKGASVAKGAGLFALTTPWPSMLRTILNDHERYKTQYFSKWGPKHYFPGDGAKRDSEGNICFLGRVDDVMNVSGHRIGTMEIESALVDHPVVAESAVVSRKHPVKGECIVAFVTLKQSASQDEETVEMLKQHVAEMIGSFARPESIIFTEDLPKTRSGKIMRRLLRDIAEGKVLGDTSTLADPQVVQELKGKYEEEGGVAPF